MRTVSIINDGQNGAGLPETPDAHDTKDERNPKEASEMRNTENTTNHDTKKTNELNTSLDTKDSMHAVLDIVSFELYLRYSESVTNSPMD